jgi:hypothetical protein
LRIKCKDENSSFSVLIPDQKPLSLTQRGCFDHEAHFLKGWFFDVTDKAWEAANALYAADGKPDKIFLVLEQTLTSKYSIAHKQGASNECEIRFYASIPLPANASAVGSYKYESAKATLGFEMMPDEGEGQDKSEYSIFLDVSYATPSRTISIEPPTLRVRLRARYQYASLFDECPDIEIL